MKTALFLYFLAGFVFVSGREEEGKGEGEGEERPAIPERNF